MAARPPEASRGCIDGARFGFLGLSIAARVALFGTAPALATDIEMLIVVFATIVITAVGSACFGCFLAYKVATKGDKTVITITRKEVSVPAALVLVAVCFAASILFFILAVQLARNESADVRTIIGSSEGTSVNPLVTTLHASDGQPPSSSGWVYMGPRRNPDAWVMRSTAEPTTEDRGEGWVPGRLLDSVMRLEGPAVIRADHFNDFHGTLLDLEREPDPVGELGSGDCVRIIGEERVGFHALWVEIRTTDCPASVPDDE